MSTTTSKPPIKDPTRLPTVEEIDRQLGPFSRYARTVRGAARVVGLSARLTWTPAGWVEHLRWGDSLIGIIHLNKSPPTAEFGVSKALEEALTPRVNNDLLKKVLAAAEGINIKWVEVPVTGPEQADAMAMLVGLKTELLSTGVVPLSPAERTKPLVRPISQNELPRASPPVHRVASASSSKAKSSGKPVAKAKKPAARRAPKRPAARVAKKAKPAAKPAAKAKAGAKRRR